MDLTPDQLLVLRCMAAIDPDRDSTKCAIILRMALEAGDELDASAYAATCNTGYESARVGELYDAIRALSAMTLYDDALLVEGRGDLELPAGPRHTECEITDAGRAYLATQDKPNGDSGSFGRPIDVTIPGTTDSAAAPMSEP